MNNFKISVVTISYNQGRFIEDCIRSVIDQDYPNFEYIVMDGGSSDQTKDVLSKYSDQITYWESKPDKGPADALNKGFNKATGRLYFYLNSDDVLLPGALSKMAEIAAKNPTHDVFYGNIYITDKNLKISRRFYSDNWNNKRFNYGLVSVAQQANFFTSEAFKKTKGFNLQNRTCWDAELLMDFSLADCSFFKTSHFFALFRLYDESITGNGIAKEGPFRQRYFEDLKRMAGKSGSEFRRYSRGTTTFIKFLIDPTAFYLKIIDRLQCIFNMNIYHRNN